MSRAGLIAGISLAALASAWPATAAARTGGWPTSFIESLDSSDRPARKPRKDRDKLADSITVPPGQLHVIVSLDTQRVALFANGTPVAHSTISSGTDSHPTQMGVFTVIQKNRHHVSNIYDAEMPYMQRLTWSGTALHQGPLPGYPASHGCIRLTPDFARLLWKTTRIGVRVVVTRGSAEPVEIAHPRLFVPRPRPVEAAREEISAAARTASTMVKTADATGTLPGAALPDSARPAGANPRANTRLADNAPPPFVSEPEMTEPAPAPPATPATAENAKPVGNAGVKSIMVEERPSRSERKPAARKNPTVSVLVSRKDSTLYVRHGREPLFDMPISIEQPDRPLGTHVYTAMEPKDGGAAMRWTVVSIPSEFRAPDEPKKSKTDRGRKPRQDKAVKVAEIETPLPSASEALDRIALPPEAVARIAELVVPGSSLIVSDNRLSNETGETTDFIVLTR